MALNNVPQSGQTLAQTRDPIRNNFSTIDGTFTTNHGAYNGALAGKHTFIEIPTAGTHSATIAGEVALYSAQGFASAIPELYFQRDGLAPNSGFSISEYQMTATAGTRSVGWTRLPSGIIVKWGDATGGGAIDTTALAGGPAFTQRLFGGLLTPFGTLGTIAIASYDPLNVAPFGRMTVSVGAGTTVYTWMVWGI